MQTKQKPMQFITDGNNTPGSLIQAGRHKHVQLWTGYTILPTHQWFLSAGRLQAMRRQVQRRAEGRQEALSQCGQSVRRPMGSCDPLLISCHRTLNTGIRLQTLPSQCLKHFLLVVSTREGKPEGSPGDDSASKLFRTKHRVSTGRSGLVSTFGPVFQV